jgi:hypothetical protein
MRRLLPGILLLMLTMSVAGCDDNTTSPTPTTSTIPATATTTETFTGRLEKNGAITFPFIATAGGTVVVTLTSVTDSALQIGLSLGTWTGAACQIVIANDSAAQNAVVTGTVTSAASLCARVYDPAAKVTAPQDFTVTVAHP